MNVITAVVVGGEGVAFATRLADEQNRNQYTSPHVGDIQYLLKLESNNVEGKGDAWIYVSALRDGGE